MVHGVNLSHGSVYRMFMSVISFIVTAPPYVVNSVVSGFLYVVSVVPVRCVFS